MKREAQLNPYNKTVQALMEAKFSLHKATNAAAQDGLPKVAGSLDAMFWELAQVVREVMEQGDVAAKEKHAKLLQEYGLNQHPEA